MESFNKGLDFGTNVAMWLLNMTAAVVGFFLPIIVVLMIAMAIGVVWMIIFNEEERR